MKILSGTTVCDSNDSIVSRILPIRLGRVVKLTYIGVSAIPEMRISLRCVRSSVAWPTSYNKERAHEALGGLPSQVRRDCNFYY
jgi:hypothetical protein